MENCDGDLDRYIMGKENPSLNRESKLGGRILAIYNIVEQILNGLVFIHSKGQIHGNLKSSNGATPA
jgi:serine/threonine protein kinase